MQAAQKLVYGAFIALLFVALACSQVPQVSAADLGGIDPGAKNVDLVKAVENTPEFPVRTAEEVLVALVTFAFIEADSKGRLPADDLSAATNEVAD